MYVKMYGEFSRCILYCGEQCENTYPRSILQNRPLGNLSVEAK